MTLRDYAQVYNDRKGWSCIPCGPRSKKALVSWKPYQQRRPDEQELNDFFTGYNNRNLAVITGDVSDRLLVIDFDRRDLFVEWWTDVFRRNTLAVATGKGVHLYFRLAEDAEPVACGNFKVFDTHAGEIRYNGGYVLAPPSIHPNGVRYKWIEAPQLEVAFDELKLERVRSTVSPNQSAAVASGVTSGRGKKAKALPPVGVITRPRRYAEAALTRECAKIERAHAGTRNTQLYTSTIKLAKYLDILGTHVIRTALAAAAAACGLTPMEAGRTINSGLNRALIRRAA